jgi:hypothetical protein
MAFTRPRRKGTGIDGLGLEQLRQWFEMHRLGQGLLYSARATEMGIDGEIIRRIGAYISPTISGARSAD